MKTDPNLTFDVPSNYGDYSDLIGSRWAERYTLTRHLGGGAFGVVFSASDDRFPTRPVAIKLGESITSKSNFVLEAKRLAEIDHMNVVRVKDYGVNREAPFTGVPYIVMDMLEGDSVDKLLEKHQHRLPDRLLLQFVREIGSALYNVHLKNLVHRDLKPHNIIYALSGEVETVGESVQRFVLLDFGIAGSTDPQASLSSKTLQGAGTLEYMAPEQAQGHECTGQADIYTFAVVVYQMLTGRVPFPLEGTAPLHALQVINAIVNTAPPKLSEVAPDRVFKPGLDELLQHCMAKSPADRPASMLEVRRRFLEIYGASATLEQDFVRRPELPVPVKRFPLVTVSLLALLAIAVVGGLLLRPGPAPQVVVVPPSPPPAFAVNVPSLALVAGEQKSLLVSFVNGGDLPPRVSLKEPVDGLTLSDPLSPNPAEFNFLDLPVQVTLNAKPGERHLTLICQQGTNTKEVVATVNILAPRIWTPSSKTFPFTYEGTIIAIEGKNYADRLVFHVPDEPPVRFILINPLLLAGEKQAPFYMMENKVWNSLYERFAAEASITIDKPAPVSGGRWTQLPVQGMKVNDAMRFGKWLGDREMHLPTVQQWWSAAGVFDRNRKEPLAGGPYLEQTSAPLTSPEQLMNLPVGTSERDISSHGIRDMGMNGKEWTSNTYPQKDYVTFPLKNPKATLFQVGTSFPGERLPFSDLARYYNFTPDEPPETWSADEPDYECGFRLVLEWMPE